MNHPTRQSLNVLSTSFRLLLFLLVFTAFASVATGQQVAKLAARDGEAFDRFGAAVDIHDDRAVIGAPWDSTVADSVLFHGSIYIFEFNNSRWQQEAKLMPTDVDNEDFFGSAVAVHGDTVAAASPWDSDAPNGQLLRGAVYVFEGNGAHWSQVKLTAGTLGKNRDFFGRALALSGDRLVVGAPGDSGQSGAAYVFERTAPGTWTGPTRLLPSVASDRLFGDAVALEDETIAVAARGAVYLFENSGGTWSEVARLADSAPLFGESIALSAGRLSVGASGDELDTSGTLHLFERLGTSWISSDTVSATGTLPGDHFASATAHLGRLSLAGSPQRGNDQAGAAMLFQRDASGNWNQVETLVPNDPSTSQLFGEAVALSQSALLVGAPGDDSRGSTTGAAYIFGIPTVAQFTGTPTVGEAPLVVTFTDLSTTAAGALRTWDFGDGSPPVSTTSPQVSHTYTQSGDFSVILQVFDGSFLGSETRRDFIRVASAPQADFVADTTSGPAPLTVTFTDQSSGEVDLRHWDFGDGSPPVSTSDASIQHTYDAAGTYDVQLQVSGPYGQSTLRRNDYIQVTAPEVLEIRNGDFEANGTNIILVGTVAQGNPIDHWTDAGTVGRNLQGGPFYNNGVTSNPENVCFLKNVSSIEQVIPHLEAGVTYRISLEANARSQFAVPRMQVELGGTVLLDQAVPPVDAFHVYSQTFRTYVATFEPSTSGSHTLIIRQTVAADATLLIDNVTIKKAPIILNPGG